MSHAEQIPQPPAPMPAPEPAKKKKPIYKRAWFWIVVVLAVIIVSAVSSTSGGSTASSTPKSSAATTSQQQSKTEDTPKASQAPATPDVPQEYKSALAKAKTYSDMMHMSKRAIYDQLTSEAGEKFSQQAGQYAVDNLKADYNANALAKAQT
ncbi:MAG: Ltp family lipoprotein, partial [Bifidobacteriales bacterium]|nr:Ltp family lipoprotein [Bifidobacteriales bacterium]